MSWIAPTFGGAIPWSDNAPPDIDAANLNLSEADTAAFAVSVGQSVVDYFSPDIAVLKEAPLNVEYPEFGGAVGGDWGTAINAAINKAFGSGIAQKSTKGGAVLIPPTGAHDASGIVLKDGVYLVGTGPGGAVFSDTDTGQPPNGSFLRLRAGATGDLIKTDNFAALDATPSSATAYNTPGRCGIRGITIDGNYWNTSGGGRGIAAFARALIIRDVIVQNAGGDGIYFNGPLDSNETEPMFQNFRVVGNRGNGINFQGAHDMIVGPGMVNNNALIGIVEGTQLGTALFSNIHAYGNGGYNWQLGCLNASHVNCISDGQPGVQFLANSVTWRDGAIYGVRNQFDELICIGDGTTRTIKGLVVDTIMFNIGVGGRMFRVRANTTEQWNSYKSNGNLGDTTPLRFGGEGYGLANGPILATATSITLSTVKTPFVTGTISVSDGTNVTTATVTSITGGNVLNLSAALGTAMASGLGNVAVWNVISTPLQSYELKDPGGNTPGLFQKASNPSGTSSMTMYDSMVMVGRLQLPNGLGASPGPALYAASGVPSNSAGNNNDWCVSDNGHIYFKAAGAWGVKV